MGLGEADTRAKLIDPALYARGWTEEMIRRETTLGSVALTEKGPKRRRKGRADYTLRVKVAGGAEPLAIALIEAKPEDKPPAHGLEQGKAYGPCERLNVQLVFSSNGHQFVEYDRATMQTRGPFMMSAFPTPDELRARYEQAMGFSLDDTAAKPLLQPYAGEGIGRRYYQDAAIRAVFEKFAGHQDEPPRALLSLATGSGKTFIAVQLLKKVHDAGQLGRALFVCDRDELRRQANAALAKEFGTEVGIVSARNAQENARVVVATYQTLGNEDDGGATFLAEHYPENYFSHIIIDECHRTAFAEWSSQVLLRNPEAAQIGLTATPRQIEGLQLTDEDVKITKDNYEYFGEPVYEYDIAQGIEDGYLAACEIALRDVLLDSIPASAGVKEEQLKGKVLHDQATGQNEYKVKPYYAPGALQAKLIIPEMVREMCEDLFSQLIATGEAEKMGPEQKTIIFCASDSHADDVAIAMNNLYAQWCAEGSKRPAEPYAFKCTAASQGGDYLADFRDNERRYFVATTVDLLTTGVDVPAVRNVVFFRWVQSPISFYQMVGRGTRIDEATNKLMFRLFDYTNATRLFGEAFITKMSAGSGGGDAGEGEPQEPDPALTAEGFVVQVNDAGVRVLAQIDGKAVPVTVEHYKQLLAERLKAEAGSLDELRERWIDKQRRAALMDELTKAGFQPEQLARLEEMDDYDLYDVLAELGYETLAVTRQARAGAIEYKHGDWLAAMEPARAKAMRGLAGVFETTGTLGLESQSVFDIAGVDAKALGSGESLRELKERIFAA